MTLTFGSLFAGIGGFDLGFEDAGMTCAWQVEKDAAARSVLARHWPNVPQHTDVCDVGAHNLAPVDVICGGFPCQDLSVAGRRAGFGGERSVLFYEMARITDELRPALLVWENVPGLLSSRGGRDFLAVLLELDRIGYHGCWTTLDAQFFGVAQRRQRVFGVFARRDIGAARCAEILSLAARLPWNTPKGREARQSVANSVTASAGHHGRSSPRGDGSDNLVTAATLTSGNATGKGVNQPGRRREDDINLVTVRAPSGYSTSGQGYWREGVGPLVERMHKDAENGVVVQVPTVAAAVESGGNNGGFRTEPGEHLVAVSVSQNQRGELRTSHISSQLTTGGGKPGEGYAAALQGSGVRRLTPVECERLQGFPDGWTAGQADSSRYRQLGNAVCASVARWLGRRIVETNQ